MPLIGMPSQKTANADDMYICPYDSVHRISARKWTIHLEKCRRNHPNVELWTCVFNARHKVHKALKQYHLSVCPDNVIIRQDITHSVTNDDGYLKGNTTVPPYTHDFPIEGSENWDAECEDINIVSQQQQQQQQQPLYRDTTGLKKSEKKKIHQRQVLEYERLCRGLPKEPQPGDIDYDDYMCVLREREAMLDSAPLRTPRAQGQVTSQGTVTDYQTAAALLPVGGAIGRGQLAQHLVQMERNKVVRKPTTRGIASSLPFTNVSTRGPPVHPITIGRGASLYKTTPPTVVSVLSVNKPLPPGVVGDTCSHQLMGLYDVNLSDSSSTSSQESSDDTQRDIRKLRKKLREIASLKNILECGGDLSRDQILKVSREISIKQKLNIL